MQGTYKERGPPCLTEKMLAANREMSNIFLHLRQNIDIT
jgi:hypothetical protein